MTVSQSPSQNPQPGSHSDDSYGIKRLAQVVRDLSHARTLEEVMKIIRRASRELANSDGATFVLRDREYCFYADEDAIQPLWKGQRFPIEACISGWAMLNKEPVSISDIYQDSRIPHGAYRPTFVKSLTMVPIRAGSPIGAIGNYWAEGHVSSPQEIELLQALADTASVAIENIRLYSALQEQVSELRHANRAKDEFLMLLSHELRTPLNSILGWGQQLLSDPMPGEDKTTPSLKKLALETIVRNARLQSHIVDGLLDSTRILSGTFLVDRRPVNLVSIVRAAEATMLPIAQSRGVEILSTFESDQIVVDGDALRLQQAVYNVLSNAVKFSPKGSQVRIEAGRVHALASIRIRDDGEGIDSEFLPKIFERFTQSDSSMTRRHGGLGIGLSIARAVMEAHQGRIVAESEGIGRGSLFTLLLMLTKDTEAENTGKTQVSVPKPLAGIRILAIDDDEDSRLLVGLVLQKRGAQVFMAESAEEGLKTLSESRPDLVICDLSMPIEDGYSFIRRVRALAPQSLSQVPAIAFSAFADREHETHALAAGFNCFVAKPLEIDLLTNKILELRPSPAV